MSDVFGYLTSYCWWVSLGFWLFAGYHAAGWVRARRLSNSKVEVIEAGPWQVTVAVNADHFEEIMQPAGYGPDPRLLREYGYRADRRWQGGSTGTYRRTRVGAAHVFVTNGVKTLHVAQVELNSDTFDERLAAAKEKAQSLAASLDVEGAE